MAILNRPDTMERINTPELAQAFIEEQIKDIHTALSGRLENLL